MVRRLLGWRAPQLEPDDGRQAVQETRPMQKAIRSWTIFTRRWTRGTGYIVGRAALLGAAFLFGMVAA